MLKPVLVGGKDSVSKPQEPANQVRSIFQKGKSRKSTLIEFPNHGTTDILEQIVPCHEGPYPTYCTKLSKILGL